MNSDSAHFSLRFAGDWPWWAGLGSALLLAIAAWLLYRREVRGARLGPRISLPLLRSLAIFLIVLMLSGPVLHHRRVIGQLSRLLLFVDGSRSMQLTDAAMDAGRKILILQRLGLWHAEGLKMDLPQAAEALTVAQGLAARPRGRANVGADEWHQLTADFEARIGAAREALSRAGFDADRSEAFVRELSVSARELASRELRQVDDRNRAAQDLGKLGEAAERWQKEINARFERDVQQMSAGDNGALKTALTRFDSLPRWQRLQSMLLEGDKEKLLARLGTTFDVRLIEMNGPEAQTLWQPTRRDSPLPASLPKPEADITNLSTPLKAAATAEGNTGRGAVVLFSDGQHNEGEPPVEVAKILQGRGLPIYTVGFGSQNRPRDLAVVKVEAPESVFFEDRIQGQIILKDDLPAGLPFTVMVQDGEKVLWQQQLISDGSNLRKVPFSFPLGDTVQERLKGKPADTEMAAVPLELKVSVSNVAGDREPANNVGTLRVRALTQKRRILLLDGRSRWETRYLRNMFERDEQWQINTVIPGTVAGADNGLPRGEKDGQFPGEAALLQPYDLIIFGEMPRALFKDEELTWIRDFVANRGGALVFIDGPRQRFKEYADSPLATLFPVEWKGIGIRESNLRLSLAESAVQTAAFALAPERTQNLDLWTHLPPPHWISGGTALPGAETMVEATADGKKVPAVVYRPFGAGKVLYEGFDDSWRWRFEVADQYHVKYWNQVANWLAELPFAVRDKLISLDAGALTYQPGDAAEIRVRVRDGQGKPVTNTAVDAVLFRDGRRVATIRLAPDENAGGLFHGRTAGLEQGSYEVGVESAAIAERDARARTSFKVQPVETGELTQLNLNEELLRQMATASGGEYLREENIDRLADLLAPISQGRVVESDTVLWQSYWWFVPIVLLLTAEWIIRKRVGML